MTDRWKDVEAILRAALERAPHERLAFVADTCAGDSDLRLEVEDGMTGRIVRFRVLERARLRVVDFQGSKELSSSEIAERLKKEQAALPLDTFFDPGRARRAENVVRRMLGEKGYPFAQVYAPDSDPVVCFEPMTAPTNALVTGGAALPMVQPGDEYRATFMLAID